MKNQKIGKKRVLVIEPDPQTFAETAEALCSMLKTHNVSCVNSVDDAVSRPANIRHDIVALGTILGDDSITIRGQIDRIAKFFPKAMFVLFSVGNPNFHNDRVKAIVQKPAIDTLARVINFLLLPKRKTP